MTQLYLPHVFLPNMLGFTMILISFADNPYLTTATKLMGVGFGLFYVLVFAMLPWSITYPLSLSMTNCGLQILLV